nr:receptor-like protein 18 isoform X2 [Ziziphus jujuba var. spinosa]
MRLQEGLSLARNQLTGPIPSRWLQCKELQILYFFSNHFTGSIPVSIGNLTKLKLLDLAENKLKDFPKEIGNLKELEELWVETNALRGPFPLCIFNMSALRSLDFSENKLSGSLPDNICHNLPNIQELLLFYNQFDGPIPSRWFQCKHLRTLSLAHNNFTVEVPTSIGNLTNLKKLDLGFNNLTEQCFLW